MPAWLSFDPLTGTFSGLPGQTDLGTLQVRVTATDEGGLAISDVFTLTVSSGVTITGTSGPDVLTGGGGIDTLVGLDGADVIDGRGGADQMNGGNGDDVYKVDNAGDSIIESFSGGLGGVDRVESTIS
ncbi:MAG: putative Ig domain-containing protein, partial [Caulobacteraceae bacterium]|nr:putative Ig domain-containing protein [Caulobacteraceae bacterium]